MYKTNSLQIAAFLRICPKIEFKGIDKSDLNRIGFLFEPEEDTQKLVDDYYGGKELPIVPQDLFNSYRSLRDLVFEERDKAKLTPITS